MSIFARLRFLVLLLISSGLICWKIQNVFFLIFESINTEELSLTDIWVQHHASPHVREELQRTIRGVRCGSEEVHACKTEASRHHKVCMDATMSTPRPPPMAESWSTTLLRHK